MDVYLKRSELTALVTAALGKASPSAQSLDEAGPLQDRGSSAVLAIGCDPKLLEGLTDLFSDQGHVLIRCRRLIDVRSRHWFSRVWHLHHISHLLVDIAALGGLARCRQDLRRIKDEMPDLPFILIDEDRAFEFGNPARWLSSGLPNATRRRSVKSDGQDWRKPRLTPLHGASFG